MGDPAEANCKVCGRRRLLDHSYHVSPPPDRGEAYWICEECWDAHPWVRGANAGSG